MAERKISLSAKDSDETFVVALRTSERAGRWVARVVADDADAEAWPGLGSPDQTQRVWVGESEAAALEVAMNWLRTQFRVSEA